MALPEINLSRLTTEEKLRLIELIWESISEDMSLTNWQQAELDRRIGEFEAGNAKTIPWEQVLKDLHRSG